MTEKMKPVNAEAKRIIDFLGSLLSVGATGGSKT
jgi:hypothetical protein